MRGPNAGFVESLIPVLRNRMGKDFASIATEKRKVV